MTKNLTHIELVVTVLHFFSLIFGEDICIKHCYQMQALASN